MATAKANCEIVDCRRPAPAFCYCCLRNVCTVHFLEHIEQMKTKISPLSTEVTNTMANIQQLTVEQLCQPLFIQLKVWQAKMHASIDAIHVEKTKEIGEMMEVNKKKFDEHKGKQLETMIKLQEDVRQLDEDGYVTRERLESLQKQLEAIKSNLVAFEKSFISVETRVLGENLVTISSKANEPPQNEPIRVPQRAIRARSSNFLLPCVELSFLVIRVSVNSFSTGSFIWTRQKDASSSHFTFLWRSSKSARQRLDKS